MIKVSVDLKLIDQERCKRITRKNGQPALFCDLVLIETPDSDCGDFMVKQDMSKEDRESGVKMPILGNAKMIVKGGAARPKQPRNDDFDPEIGF